MEICRGRGWTLSYKFGAQELDNKLQKLSSNLIRILFCNKMCTRQAVPQAWLINHLGCAFHLSNTLLHAQWAAQCGYLGALSLAFALLPPPSKMSTKSCAFECVHNFLTAQSVALVLL